MAPRERPSSIDRLPSEVKELIGRLRQDGRTIDEILAKLQELDVEVSRSALGRHVKSMAVVGERMRRSRDVAKALVNQFGDQPDNQIARLNLELMHGVVMQLMMAAAEAHETPVEDGAEEGGERLVLGPQDVRFLADALYRLSAAEKNDADRHLKLRAEFAREAAKKLDAAVASGEVDKAAMVKAKRIMGFDV